MTNWEAEKHTWHWARGENSSAECSGACDGGTLVAQRLLCSHPRDGSAQPEQQEAARQALVLQGKQEPLHPPKQAGVLQWILDIF